MSSNTPSPLNTNSNPQECARCSGPFPKYTLDATCPIMSCCGAQICGPCITELEHQDRRQKSRVVHNQTNVAPGVAVVSYENRLSDEPCIICNKPMATDAKQAHQKLLEASRDGHAWAQYSLAVDFEKNGSPRKAAQWYRKAAVQGHPGAQSALGLMYQHGEGNLSRSNAEAKYWLEKSAEQDYANGMLNLAGILAEEGDSDRSMKLLHKLANEGLAKAQCKLADQYFQKQNVKEATVWYTKSALQGNTTAQHNLVGCYLQTQQLSLLMYWLDKLTQQQDRNEAAEAQMKKLQIVQQLSRACVVCRKTLSATSKPRCSGCHAHYYCSKECQVRHWKGGHKKECNEVSTLRKVMKY